MVSLSSGVQRAQEGPRTDGYADSQSICRNPSDVTQCPFQAPARGIGTLPDGRFHARWETSANRGGEGRDILDHDGGGEGIVQGTEAGAEPGTRGDTGDREGKGGA